MAGDVDELTRDEAAQILRWWLEAGVDCAVAEQPRHWLSALPRTAPAEPATGLAAPPPNELPSDYQAFRVYLEGATGLPLDRPGARRVLPHGIVGARIMLLSDVPGREDADRPIGGEAWALTEKMLAAIGIASDEAYSASLACFHLAGGRLSQEEVERCAVIGRRHVALVAPERLLLFGEAAARAMLGMPLPQARGRIHSIEGVRAVATFHPRQLLQRPGDKALAWRDLLLLMEDA